jgi:hypothetical protein
MTRQRLTREGITFPEGRNEVYLDDSDNHLKIENEEGTITDLSGGPYTTSHDAIHASGIGVDWTAAGFVPVKQIMRANATRTFTSNTNVQALFTTPAAGALSAGLGTYLFEGLIKVNTLHADAGNFLLSILGAGDAVTAAWLWTHMGLDATDPTVAAAISGGFAVTSGSPAAVVAAGTGTGAGVYFKGTFEVTTAGTIIPSLDQLTASAAVLEIGSYITFERISTSVALTSVGSFA